MKVLHVLAPASYGGLERVVHALAVGQRDRGYDVRILALLDAGVLEPLTIAELRQARIDVRPIALHGRAYARRLGAIRDECVRFAPNVLHTHGYVSDVLSGLLSVSASVRKVSTAHGFGNGPWKERAYEWLQRRAYRRFDAVIAVSNRLANQLIASGVPAGRVHAIANALPSCPPTIPASDARRLLNIPTQAFSVGWVGRVTQEKGLDVFLDALPSLADVPFHATIIGDGRDRATNERRARTLGVSDRVAWRGAVPGAASLLSAFDVLAMSSRSEGTPIILLEAMAAHVPIVATAVGGIPDVVSKSEALLVAPESPRALSDALRAIYCDAAAAADRAARAAARIESEFAVDPWVERYHRVYVSLR
jgi:glycosyltransferase involved in cell wall biosynthesis